MTTPTGRKETIEGIVIGLAVAAGTQLIDALASYLKRRAEEKRTAAASTTGCACATPTEPGEANVVMHGRRWGKSAERPPTEGGPDCWCAMKPYRPHVHGGPATDATEPGEGD